MKRVQVLVVEDEGIVAKDIQYMLKALGYDVPVTVASGEQAIVKTEENRPDLVLMDIHLAGAMDGVEAAQTIKARFDIPVVYLTANSDEATLQRAKLTDPFGFLLKPFEERSLHSTIEMALYKHKTDKQIREREQWLSTTLKSIADGVITTDEKGVITFINAVGETLTRWESHEAVGKSYEEVFRIIDESTRAKSSDRVAHALFKGISGVFNNHTLLLGKRGEETHIEYSVAPIQNQTERVSGSVIVFCDVTGRKELEEKLRQSQKMEAIGNLAGGVAHDFNNVLTAIIGYSEFIASKMTADDPFLGDIQEVLRAGQHAAGLTYQLLAFSRKQVLKPRTLDLNETISDLDGLLRRVIGEHISIVNMLAGAPCCVKADPGQIQQVIINMAINARDAMPGGGVLTIETANVTLNENAVANYADAAPGEYVLIKISDNGMGMDEATRAKIFEPFFTTKGNGRGTGLGLSTCYGIVLQTGGWIDVESKPGAGTCFKIHLPREAGPLTLDVFAKEGGLPRGNETILVVEDEAVVRTLIARTLRDLGYRVLEAGNGAEAQMVIIENGNVPIDLVVTDVVMPVMGGKALMEWFRASGQDIAGIFVSGYTDDLTTQEAVAKGEVRFISKPFTAKQLAQTVHEVLTGNSAPLCEAAA